MAWREATDDEFANLWLPTRTEGRSNGGVTCYLVPTGGQNPHEPMTLTFRPGEYPWFFEWATKFEAYIIVLRGKPYKAEAREGGIVFIDA